MNRFLKKITYRIKKERLILTEKTVIYDRTNGMWINFGVIKFFFFFS